MSIEQHYIPWHHEQTFVSRGRAATALSDTWFGGVSLDRRGHLKTVVKGTVSHHSKLITFCAMRQAMKEVACY